MSDIRTTAEAVEDAALPCAHAVHADGACPDPVVLPQSAAKVPVDQKSPARWAYERLVLYIQNFEKQLDSEQEAAMGFAGTHSGVLRIEGEMGNKKVYDPRSYLKAAEQSMADRIAVACDDLLSTGKSIYKA